MNRKTILLLAAKMLRLSALPGTALLLSAGAATPAFAQYTLTTLATFNGTNGSYPSGGVILSGGILYGTTLYGGNDNTGTVFSLPVGGGTLNMPASFNGTTCEWPQGGVILSGGNLYGTAGGTADGGANNTGTVFSLPIGGGTPNVLASFNGTNGGALSPSSGVILYGGNLYGTAGGGTKNYGTVFSVPVDGSSSTPNVLVSFTGLNSNGTNGGASSPSGGVILSGGILYGTGFGGANGDGTVFSVPVGGGNLNGPYVQASFNGTNGRLPESSLILYGGNLYGTTAGGGANNAGTVFSISAVGNNITTLASFNGTNGSSPESGLILYGGNLYGTTATGGANNEGTVFSLPVGGGTLNMLASFNGTDGANPQCTLISDGNGNLYGTTPNGGSGNGTLFELVAPATANYTLAASITGGRLANGRLTQGQTANLTATVNSTGGNGTDNLVYDTLTITGAAGIAIPTPGSGNIAQGTSGNATGTFTATTLVLNTLTPGIGNATNATLGGNATSGGSTTASVYVDALAEHVNAASITDTGNASTTPTAFYRQNAAWGGDNLGNVTVTKEAAGSYIPAYANNINGGSGTPVGTLKITVSGDDNMFGSDTSIIMLGFQNVNHNGTGSGSLTTIEGALTTAGIEWRDYTGANYDWPTLARGVDPLTGTSQFQSVADYDIELAFSGGSLTSSTSYFDFNFTDQLGNAGNVVNIAVVPEPAMVSMPLIAGAGMLMRRRRRQCLGVSAMHMT